MALTSRHRTFSFIVYVLVSHAGLLQQIQGEKVITSPVYEKSNVAENSSSSSGSAETGNSNSSSHVWIASTSNCSCLREMAALKHDLREEVSLYTEVGLYTDIGLYTMVGLYTVLFKVFFHGHLSGALVNSH